MYNPYLQGIAGFLRPMTGGGSKTGGAIGGILRRLRGLDEDDLLLLMILLLLMKHGEWEGQWPLLAAVIYCML